MKEEKCLTARRNIRASFVDELFLTAQALAGHIDSDHQEEEQPEIF